MQASRPVTLLSDSNTGVFCQYCEILKNSSFIEHMHRKLKTGKNVLSFGSLLELARGLPSSENEKYPVALVVKNK